MPWHSKVKMLFAPSIAKASSNKDFLELLLISFLSLFFEMICIRWLPTNIRMLAYFTNFVLISCFLGLGIGVAVSTKLKNTILHFQKLLLGLVIGVSLLRNQRILLPFSDKGDFIWNGLSSFIQAGVASYLLLLAFFLINTVLFIPLGQVIGEKMSRFKPIAAYSINILGSILGIIAFSLMSFLSLPPIYWFGVGLLGILWFTKDRLRSNLIYMFLICVLIFIGKGYDTFWSPYYEIRVTPIERAGTHIGIDLAVNQDSHQQALNLRPEFLQDPFLDSRRWLYDLPYCIKKQPQDVLILGAGTGNDVAAALRNNSKRIDAVDIDPVILQLGRKLHPEAPYQNNNVKVYVEDARSFLRKTEDKYDLIVFGFLDSHSLFSSMSNVRLDNYVYTVQAFQDVKRRLKEHGVVALTFCVHEKWIADRLFNLLRSVFEKEPLIFQGNKDAWGTVFLVGDNLDEFACSGETKRNLNLGFSETEVNQKGGGYSWPYLDQVQGFVDNRIFSREMELSTDDWPYLYMRDKTVPNNYLLILFLIFLASASLVGIAVPKANKINGHFFFLGSAFMLVETKSITELALLFGSTWFVNSVVITAILVMILLANLYAAKFSKIRIEVYYVFLFGMLALNYFMSWQGILKQGFLSQVLFSSFIISIPLFFAAIIFANSFKQTENIPSAFGSNLIGAVLGGLFEYSALANGLKSLYLLALVMYFLSFVFLKIGRES